MFPAPLTVRCKGKNAGDEANNAVGFLRFEKRTMTTIMENDERSHEEKSGERGKWNAQPKRDVFHEIHCNPECKEWNEGVHDLPYGSTNVWLLKFSDKGFPFLVSSCFRQGCLGFVGGL